MSQALVDDFLRTRKERRDRKCLEIVAIRMRVREQVIGYATEAHSVGDKDGAEMWLRMADQDVVEAVRGLLLLLDSDKANFIEDYADPDQPTS